MASSLVLLGGACGWLLRDRSVQDTVSLAGQCGFRLGLAGQSFGALEPRKRGVGARGGI